MDLMALNWVAELVKSFEHVNEILDGFRYKMGAVPAAPPRIISHSAQTWTIRDFANSNLQNQVRVYY